jgi:hypothetical protein
MKPEEGFWECGWGKGEILCVLMFSLKGWVRELERIVQVEKGIVFCM